MTQYYRPPLRGVPGNQASASPQDATNIATDVTYTVVSFQVGAPGGTATFDQYVINTTTGKGYVGTPGNPYVAQP